MGGATVCLSYVAPPRTLCSREMLLRLLRSGNTKAMSTLQITPVLRFLGYRTAHAQILPGVSVRPLESRLSSSAPGAGTRRRRTVKIRILCVRERKLRQVFTNQNLKVKRIRPIPHCAHGIS